MLRQTSSKRHANNDDEQHQHQQRRHACWKDTDGQETPGFVWFITVFFLKSAHGRIFFQQSFLKILFHKNAINFYFSFFFGHYKGWEGADFRTWPILGRGKMLYAFEFDAPTIFDNLMRQQFSTPVVCYMARGFFSYRSTFELLIIYGKANKHSALS
jgi:hypothetical protein